MRSSILVLALPLLALVLAACQPAAAGTSTNTSDTQVEVLGGGIHTVYHSTAPLPSATAPRADGKPTLVWFSATWCEVCHVMEPIVKKATVEIGGRVVFVEKSHDLEPELFQQHRVFGTPTFVLLDAQGKELTRFNVERTPERFASRVLQAAGR